MRIGYFTMPVHPPGRPPAETLREDREAILLADRLGYHDAFVGEHLTDLAENITSSLLFLATLIHATRDIRLATGTANLSHSHPVLIASHAALFDHLSGGRFIFGVSPGALACDAEALGILDEDRNRMFGEAIDVILAIWERDPPYDIAFPGNRWPVSTARTRFPEVGIGTLYKPLQRPRPEIVGTVVAPHSRGVITMGERDFHPLSTNFLLPRWLPSHWDNYAQGRRNAGANPDRADWRVARTILVADDSRVAAQYGGADPGSPYRFYKSQLLAKLRRSNRHGVFKTHPEQDDAEITVDYVLDQLVIAGTVNEVVDRILKLREEIGDFGELVYAGMDWVDPALAKRSMELMATEVMPRVNAAIGAGASVAAAA
jgi:alkanesulfonate monooxygenase SsuD/methylene tetrahydromethanopterin reductase-like flavin-dependent oxidoreductase (luciferase family)